ncbi:Nucleoside diphosphate kinase 5 [Chionoecetes opilio]|uniref:Nucleoside diphosphate kinase homolog 5 n=1 Tax=Chionoecetes opilio TaxID=41210 RepID=A0A8J4YBP0_CHIOP|nr:Nucleoside diphosphate kinase 5 [Chionoecetes opilio]
MADKIQRTLAMVKPDALEKWPQIEKVILDEGFTIVDVVSAPQPAGVKVLPRAPREHFFVPSLIHDVRRGEDAVTHWRRVLGPTRVSAARQEAPGSVRALYGDPHNDTHNAAHGSDSLVAAGREIKFFFPDLTLEPVLTGEGAKEYLSHAVSPTLVKALTELCKVRPEDPIVWLADWLLVHNPNKPHVGDE